MAAPANIAKLRNDIPSGVIASVLFLLLLVSVTVASIYSRDFGTRILAALLSVGLAIAWLYFWMAGLWRSWIEEWPSARSRFFATLLSFPLGVLLLFPMTSLLVGVVRYAESAQYETLLSDQHFLSAVKAEENSLEFEGITVKIDRTDDVTRLAFDEQGYVVLSSAYVYDPTEEVESLDGMNTNWYFGSEVSQCNRVREHFYLCSFR